MECYIPSFVEDSVGFSSEHLSLLMVAIKRSIPHHLTLKPFVYLSLYRCLRSVMCKMASLSNFQLK